jgi:hypothetical protein
MPNSAPEIIVYYPWTLKYQPIRVDNVENVALLQHVASQQKCRPICRWEGGGVGK